MKDVLRKKRVASSTAVLVVVAFLGAAVLGCGIGGNAYNRLPPNTPVVPAGLTGRLVMPREGALVALALPTGGLTQLAPQPSLGGITSARWSPDGSQVAYARFEVRDQRFPLSELWVVQADGTGALKVLPADQAQMLFQAPVWDPSGTRLYYVHSGTQDGADVHRIERLTLATGEQELVLSEEGAFDVSPDGQTLALVRSAGGDTSLVAVALSTGEQRELIPRRRFATITGPRFDPTSRTLLFSAAEPARASAEPGPTPVLDLAVLLVPVAWAHGLPQDIWSLPVVGGQPTRLNSLQGDDPYPTWSPDGSRFAALATEALWIAPAAGGTPSPILYPGSSGSLDWAP